MHLIISMLKQRQLPWQLSKKLFVFSGICMWLALKLTLSKALLKYKYLSWLSSTIKVDANKKESISSSKGGGREIYLELVRTANSLVSLWQWKNVYTLLTSTLWLAIEISSIQLVSYTTESPLERIRLEGVFFRGCCSCWALGHRLSFVEGGRSPVHLKGIIRNDNPADDTVVRLGSPSHLITTALRACCSQWTIYYYFIN